MSAVSPLPNRGSRLAAPARPGRPVRPPAEQAEPNRRADLRAVGRHRRIGRLATTIASTVATLTLALAILGIVALNALAAEASFEARSLERELSQLTLEHDDLLAAVAQLESPTRVRDVALGQLGLMAPEIPGFLEIDPADMPTADIKPRILLGN